MASPNGTILNLDTTIFSGFLPDKKGLLWAEILNAFWDLGLVESDTKLHKYNVYHQYFIIELDAWRFCSSNVSLETYRDLVNLVKHLKENKGAPRNSPQILAFFGSATMDPKYDSAIFLAVRLWLMINVGSPNLQRVFPGKSNIIWSPDSSINSLLETQFPHHPTMLSAPQLPRNLNVYELERVAGLDVVWTDHLTDHLQLDLDLNRINIYHHVSVLKCQEHDQGPQSIFPEGLLDETLQSLALLIPRGNIDCKTWAAKQQRLNPNKVDPQVSNLGLNVAEGRRPQSYRFWNERLIILHKAFEECQPKGLHQFWVDRRNKMQWYTFWIAVVVLVLTVVFGLTQSITGILQVNLAYHPISASGSP